MDSTNFWAIASVDSEMRACQDFSVGWLMAAL
jgi:hypothetical protein